MSSPGGGRRQTGRPWWKAVGERVPRQFGSRRTGKGNGRRTTDDRQDNRRPATDGRRQRPTADNRQPTGRRTTRRPTATTDGNDRRQDDRRPNRRPTTRRVKNNHNPRTSIPSGGYRAIGPTGGITVSERRHTSPEVGHGEGVKASGVHPKRGRAVRKRFVLFCCFFCLLKRFHLCETPSLHFAFSFFLSFYSTHVSTRSLTSTYLLFLSSLVALPHTVLTCSILHPHCGSTSTALQCIAFSHFIQPVSEQSVMAKKGRKQSILKSKEHDAKKEGGRH